MCILCILIPLLTGLICGLLGYLLGRMSGKKKCTQCDELNLKLKEAKDEFMRCKTDLNICKVTSAQLQRIIDDLNKQNESAKVSFAATAPAAATVLPFDAKLAAAVFGEKIAQDDLKIVEGIGPKIEELFHASGIKTWKALAETSVETCREILKAGGERFQMHDPETWPQQCEMAYKGKWKELKEWQEKLDAGRK